MRSPEENLQYAHYKKWHFKDVIIVILSILTTVFWIGYSVANFATTKDVEERDNKIISLVVDQNKQVMNELKTLNSQVAELRGSKADKPNR